MASKSNYGPSKSAFLYTLTVLGWILFLGPQLEPHVGSVKQKCLRLWDEWQRVEDGAINQTSTDTAPINTGYTTRIVSYDPFIMHIENFVSPEEREYILELG